MNPQTITCPTCGGTRWVSGYGPCDDCYGTGRIPLASPRLSRKARNLLIWIVFMACVWVTAYVFAVMHFARH